MRRGLLVQARDDLGGVVAQIIDDRFLEASEAPAGLIATYCKPMPFSTSAIKSEPGLVMNVSLGSLPAAGFAAGAGLSAPSVAFVSVAAAAIALPATAAVPFRNERRPGLLLPALSSIAISSPSA
jgi:hypothetical protein